jgi:nitrite reductase/ring-hydroxylating ferredoxin subunit
MERKTFIKTCGFACLNGTLFASLLESCSTSKIITGKIEETNLVVPVSSFELEKGSFRKYVVAQPEQLKYPICIYRFSEEKYSALWMRCTHQGAELQVFGDRLECPAHGSEFSDTGAVLKGPAAAHLRTFPVTIQHNQLYISLK